MAKKTASRLELRKMAEAAEKRDEEAAKDGTETPKKKRAVKAKDPAAAEAKKKAPKKPSKPKKSKVAVVTRKRMLWGVFDNSNNRVAAFPFNDRPGADQKAKDMTAKGKGTYFVQPVKEPIEEEEEPADA
jgi:hypothetical protein